jgi:hypothetical protein
VFGQHRQAGEVQRQGAAVLGLKSKRTLRGPSTVTPVTSANCVR